MRYILLTVLILFGLSAVAQQTILNIPSADVLDKKQVYFRLDTTWLPSPDTASLAPNLIFGLGHNVEAGVNINAFGIPADSANRSIVPNIKWRLRAGKSDAPNHFDIYVGDQVYLPTFHRTFDVGNYAYAAGAFTIHSDTRFTFGGWNSNNFVADGDRGGALLGLEQTVAHQKQRNLVTLAADWQSGRGANGALTLGVMVFPTSKLMIIPAWQIPNSGDHNANGAQIFIGYMLH